MIDKNIKDNMLKLKEEVKETNQYFSIHKYLLIMRVDILQIVENS